MTNPHVTSHTPSVAAARELTPNGKTREVRLELLRPHPRNPRVITPYRLEQLGRTLEAEREMLQARPLIALPDGTVVAGNQRLEAARALGWATIPAVIVELDEDRATRWMLLDNRGFGDDDKDATAALLAELQAAESDLDLTGFDKDAVDRLLRSFRQREKEPDATLAIPAKPKSQPGEVYELGPHRLVCGDSTNTEHVALALNGAEPKLMLTDPPYGIELDGEWRDRVYNQAPAAKSYMRIEGHTNKTMSNDTKADWSDAFELVPSLEYAYIWHASRFSDDVMAGLKRIGFEPVQQIIWDKELFAMSRQHYHWQHEPCFYVRKVGAKVPWFGDHKQTTVWRARSPKMIMGGSKELKVDHPTQKPVVLYTVPIENHLEADAPFYEPFGGSGSAIIAAEITGRVCHAVELDPRFVDVIRQRYADFVEDQSFAP